MSNKKEKRMMQKDKNAAIWIPMGGYVVLEHAAGEHNRVRIESATIQVVDGEEFINLALKDKDGDFYYLLTQQTGPNLLAAYKRADIPTGATVHIKQEQ